MALTTVYGPHADKWEKRIPEEKKLWPASYTAGCDSKWRIVGLRLLLQSLFEFSSKSWHIFNVNHFLNDKCKQKLLRDILSFYILQIKWIFFKRFTAHRGLGFLIHYLHSITVWSVGRRPEAKIRTRDGWSRGREGTLTTNTNTPL